MTVSNITGITQEGQPQELSSFLRSGVVYVLWHSPISLALRRLSWKPHNAANFTEVVPALGQAFHGVSALYDPATDHVVVVWDDGTAVDGSTSGSLYIARFKPTDGTLVSGPTVLFPGSNPKLAYRSTTQDSNWLLYYRTAKNKGVYGSVTADGGLTWESAYPIWTGQVADTSFLDAASYSSNHASIAQLGSETKKLREVSLLQRTRPLVSIVKHPTSVDQFFVGEPSKFDNVTLTDNLRGALGLSTDNTKLYNLDGVQQGTSDSVGAVARITVTGTTLAVAASAGPTGNGDDIREYTLVPGFGTLNVDLPGTSYAVDLAVSSTHGYIAEYADNATSGQFVVVDLSTGSTGTVLSALTGVRAVAVANFLSTPLIFVATTESGVERLRVYSQNALTPTLLLNTKLTSRCNALSVAVDPSSPTGALVFASLTDRLNVYKYVSSSAPVQLTDTLTLPGGGSFFRSQVASNGNIFVAAGNAGLLCLDSNGKILAQTSLSGEVVSEWVRNTVYSAGALVRPRESHQFAKARYYFRTAAGGTSGGGEPSWASTGTVSDNTVSWTPVGLVDGVAVGLALDEANQRVLVTGSAGGNLGTDGRVWLVQASGLISSPTLVDSDTVAMWKFDETSGTTAADASPNVLTLTAPGTNPTIAAGRLLNGRFFNGTSTWMDATPSSQVRSDCAGSLTIEGWIWLDPAWASSSGTFHSALIELQTTWSGPPSTAQPQFGIDICKSPPPGDPTQTVQALSFYWYGIDGTGYGNSHLPITVPVGVWTHFAWRRRFGGGTYDLDYFQNGVFVQRVSGAGGDCLTGTTNKFRVGAIADTGTPPFNYWKGGIDHIRISKVARTDAEILKFYRSGLI